MKSSRRVQKIVILIAMLSLITVVATKIYVDAAEQVSSKKTVYKNGQTYTYYSTAQSYDGSANAKTRIEAETYVAEYTMRASTYLVNASSGSICKSVAMKENSVRSLALGVNSSSCTGSHDHYAYGIVGIKTGTIYTDYTTHTTGSISSRSIPSYFTNGNNQTYGPIICESFYDIQLDLIQVTGISGNEGYITRNDLLLPEVDENTLIPVYDFDGTTIVDDFLLEIN